MQCSAARLRTFRLIAGFTQYELASKIGRGQCWVSFVERGIAKPSPLDVASIARALGLPANSLQDGADAERLLTRGQVSRMPGLRWLARLAPPSTRFLLISVPGTALMLLVPITRADASEWWGPGLSALHAGQRKASPGTGPK